MVKININELAERLKIKIGVENELLTVNRRGLLVSMSQLIVNEIINDIANKRINIAHMKKLIYGLQWEPHPAQIEIVTQPLPFHLIYDAINLMWSYLSKVARRKSLRIYVGSVHPVQSNPFPLNGTHVSLSIIPKNRRVMPRKFLVYIHNIIRNYTPELIAISANSPIIAGMYSGYASSRLFYSRVLKPSKYAIIRRSKATIIPREKRSLMKYAFIFTSEKKYEHRVVADQVGLRFLDVTPRGPYTNIIEDRWADPRVSRIEVRFLDNPTEAEYLMDLIALLLGLSLKGIHHALKNEKLRERQYLLQNRMNAIRDGINATIIEDSKEIPIRDKVVALIAELEQYLDALGIRLTTSIRHGRPEMEHYGPPRITTENEKLMNDLSQRKLFVTVHLSGTRTLIDFTGSRVRLTRKIISGIAFPEYKLTWKENKQGAIARYKTIHISFWLLTRHGYIRLYPEDKIIKSKTPISRIVELLRASYNYFKSKNT